MRDKLIDTFSPIAAAFKSTEITQFQEQRKGRNRRYCCVSGRGSRRMPIANRHSPEDANIMQVATKMRMAVRAFMMGKSGRRERADERTERTAQRARRSPQHYSDSTTGFDGRMSLLLLHSSASPPLVVGSSLGHCMQICVIPPTLLSPPLIIGRSVPIRRGPEKRGARTITLPSRAM